MLYPSSHAKAYKLICGDEKNKHFFDVEHTGYIPMICIQGF